MEIRRGFAGPSPPSETLRQCTPRLGMSEGRGEGAWGSGRSAALTLKLCSSSRPAGERVLAVSPGEGLPWPPGTRLTARERERESGSERAWEAGVQLCPTRSSTAHCKPLERACAEQSLGQAGGRRSGFLATLINLLRIAPSEGIRLDSPWREDTPLEECWVAAFFAFSKISWAE